MTNKPTGQVVEGFGPVLDELGKREKDAQQTIQDFAANFEGVTGYKPQQQMNALDVMKIVYKIYGEPK